MPETKQTDQQIAQLGPNDLQLFEYVSQRYDAVVPQGITPEALLEPAFWAHHAVKLRPMNEIRARAEDGTWIADLVVLDCSRTWAKVAVLAVHRLTTADVARTQASEAEVKTMISQHSVMFNQGRKWHIVRKGDRAVVQDQIGEKEAATAWLEKHVRATLGVPAKAVKPTADAVPA